MDHKVSKDMISSGMIPSGEKTQADLGRTQYGSAPSPSSLMEAYRSIYEHHQKDADGNTIPHEGEEINEAVVTGSLLAAKALGGLAAKAGAGIAAKTAAAGGAKAVAGKAAMGVAKQAVADKAVSTVARGLKKKEPIGASYEPTGEPIEEIAPLLAGKAVRAVGGAVKKVADKAVSTIAGGKVKQPIAAGADLFDIVKGKLLDEGLTEEESLDVMLTLTLDEINEVIKLDEVSSELLMKAAKGAEVARGKAASAGDKDGAVKKLKQGEKFYKGAVEKRKAAGQMGAGYKESK